MTDVVVRLGHHSVAITLPEHLLRDGVLGSLAQTPAATAAHERLIVSEAPDRSFVLKIGRRRPEAGLKRGPLALRLLDVLAERFAAKAQAPVLSAAAVKRGGGAILIAGPEGCGKSSLAAWLIEKGFAFIADKQVALLDETGTLAGYPTPLSFAAADAAHLLALADVAGAPMARIGERILIGARPAWIAQGASHACRMMIFPRHARDKRARLEMLDTASAAVRLAAQRISKASRGADPDLWPIKMAQSIPAIALSYSDYGEIDGLVDRLARLTLDEKLSPADFTRFVSGIGQPRARSRPKRPVPERSSRRFSPFLTIGMATYDDYDGVYFSLQAIRLYHPEILDEVEFLIIDNHPEGRGATALKRLEDDIPNLRYVPASDMTGTAVKSRVFSEAQGEFVLCMDCHVLFAPGGLKALIDYFRAAPESNDLIQGPLIRDKLDAVSTHWVEKWRNGMFGDWSTDPRGEAPDAPPFEIAFQGLGVFACRREAWLGFNPAFRGFGGEEGYLHEKFRQAGRRTLCLPALRWLHRFGRPFGAPYPNTWEDRIRNYTIGFREIGWTTDDMLAHFRETIGRRKADRIFAAVRRELDGEAEVKPEIEDGDQPYDLNEARLRFVAEIAAPVLRESFAVTSAVCAGRGAEFWAQEFSRLGVSSHVIEPLAARKDPPASLACCCEVPDVSSIVQAEKLVQWLTGLAPVVLFLFAPPPGAPRRDKRQQAVWAELFAQQGYGAVDCLDPVLKGDPRADRHYQHNIAVFGRQGTRQVLASQKRARRPARKAKPAETGVSVILPVHNGAAYLAGAIESVLLQNHRALELIVVNDGSTDGSGAIADDYARADKRVRVVHQDNRGEAAAANAGFAKARFALVARLDHDDVALPERLALQVAFMNKYDEIAAIGGAMRFIDGEGKPTGASCSYPLTSEACREQLANSTVPPIANPTAMIRKAAFDKIGGYRLQFRKAPDLDFWLRLDEQFKLANLPDPLVDYRSHGENMTHRQRFAQALEAEIARQAALLRRSRRPDPVDGWTRLDLDTLQAFAMPDEEKSRAYRALFDAALANFGKTRDEAYLRLAQDCLARLPADLATR